MTNHDDVSRVGGYLLVFAAGAAIGAGLALLYAPRTGEETRKLLAEKGRGVQHKLHDTVEDAKGYVRGKEAELKAAFEAGKQAMREERAKHEHGKA